MIDGTVPPEESKDERDPVRTPMQWNKDRHAGFSCATKPWLPVNRNYLEGLNVEAQINDTASHLNYYKNMMKLKKLDVFKKGSFEYKVIDNVLYILRGIESVKYVVILNFNDKEIKVDPAKAFSLSGKLSYAFPHSKGRDERLYFKSFSFFFH